MTWKPQPWLATPDDPDADQKTGDTDIDKQPDEREDEVETPKK